MFNLVSFIRAAGYIGVAGIVFAESGLLVGFFLPGDSLLFTAGLLASQHYLNIFILMLVSFIAAVIGDSVGYAFGKKAGPKAFSRENSFLFHPEQLSRAKKFFKKHGPKAVILGRFLPIIRTLTPVFAGVGIMPYRTFLINNIIGGALWTIGISGAGYYLGATVPNIDHYIVPIILAIIVVSVLPALISLLRDKSQREHVFMFVRQIMYKK